MNRITGDQIYELVGQLFPICRSITGQGVRDTLAVIQRYIGENIKLKICETPSGTQVFDWTVPKEWRIREAYIEDEAGNRIIDFKNNNLHVMGYATPVDRWVELDELKKYIYTQEDQPDVIPYVTSYYKERYGFCMSEYQKNALQPGRYHMVINSELFNGSLSYGEIVLPGKCDKEVFFSTYICHPSMANNECSGPALSAELVKYVYALKNRKYTYRFIYIPETIGSITYLSREGHMGYLKEHMIAGFNLSCVGDDRIYSMVESRYADTLADKVLKNVLKNNKKAEKNHKIYSFLERGSDERQYNAPGVDLPVVCFCRSKFGKYPEYHTSADNMGMVSPSGFQGSYDVMTQVINALEHNERYKVSVFCEPQLGRRGLYPTVSQKGNYDIVKAMTDFIAYADGKNDLIDISDMIHQPIETIIPIVEKLIEKRLIVLNK